MYDRDWADATARLYWISCTRAEIFELEFEDLQIRHDPDGKIVQPWKCLANALMLSQSNEDAAREYNYLKYWLSKPNTTVYDKKILKKLYKYRVDPWEMTIGEMESDFDGKNPWDY